MTRECDNDDCDYVTYVDDAGHPRVRWEHVSSCAGLVRYELPDPGDAPDGSFQAYLLGRGWGSFTRNPYPKNVDGELTQDAP